MRNCMHDCSCIYTLLYAIGLRCAECYRRTESIWGHDSPHWYPAVVQCSEEECQEPRGNQTVAFVCTCVIQDCRVYMWRNKGGLLKNTTHTQIQQQAITHIPSRYMVFLLIDSLGGVTIQWLIRDTQWIISSSSQSPYIYIYIIRYWWKTDWKIFKLPGLHYILFRV